jgi:plastocyanin
MVVVLLFGRPGGGSSSDHRFVIPAGTAARVAAGDPVAILPERLEVRVGDTITLVNEDDSVQQTGFLSVGPHETLTYRFSRPGSYTSTCNLHPEGTLEIVVT